VSSSKSTGSGRGLGGGSYARRGGVGSGSGGGMGSGSVAEARVSQQSAALAQELGDLFEYKLKEPITILKNRSALVPIVQSAITADKVSIWNERAGLPKPQRALWLTNSSGVTLDSGSFSVLEQETFAGEGLFEQIRPGEKRLVSYATDLALNVSSRSDSESQRISQVRVNRGVMTHISEIREKKTYVFRNADSSSRTVVVEHPARPGYELRGDIRPVESTPVWMRFQLPVEPAQTASLVVDEARPVETTYQVSNINSDQLGVFVRQKSIDKSIEGALREILTQKSAVNALKTQNSELESESEKIFDDQQRLRENMKVLKGSAEEKALLQRYTAQLNTQENRLEALKQEAQKLEAQIEAAESALDKMIQDLSFDVKL
jgi:hypothetical protein